MTPINVLTGFKYIGEKIAEYEKTKQYTFLFGYEESYGFLSAGYVRDKDAVAGSLLIAEMAAYYKSIGTTLYGAIHALYKEYGYYGETVLNIQVGGIDPMAEMNKRMAGAARRAVRQHRRLQGHTRARLSSQNGIQSDRWHNGHDRSAAKRRALFRVGG